MINPSHDYALRPGDIVYLLKPGTVTSMTSMMNNTMSMELVGEAVQLANSTATAANHNETTTTAAADTNNMEQRVGGQDVSPPLSGKDLSSKTAFALRFPGASHLSIDESWLEDALSATVDAANATTTEPRRDQTTTTPSLSASKLNFTSLKRLFQATPPPPNVSQLPPANEDEATWLTEVATHGKVRSKSIAAPSSQYRRGKITKQALRKMFYNRSKENDIATKTSI